MSRLPLPSGGGRSGSGSNDRSALPQPGLHRHLRGTAHRRQLLPTPLLLHHAPDDHLPGAHQPAGQDNPSAGRGPVQGIGDHRTGCPERPGRHTDPGNGNRHRRPVHRHARLPTERRLQLRPAGRACRTPHRQLPDRRPGAGTRSCPADTGTSPVHDRRISGSPGGVPLRRGDPPPAVQRLPARPDETCRAHGDPSSRRRRLLPAHHRQPDGGRGAAGHGVLRVGRGTGRIHRAAERTRPPACPHRSTVLGQRHRYRQLHRGIAGRPHRLERGNPRTRQAGEHPVCTGG